MPNARFLSPRVSVAFPCASLWILGAAIIVAGNAGCVGFIHGGDGSDETGDENPTGDGDGDTGEDTTIYAIQGGEVAEGTRVRVSGVVVTSPVNAERGLAFVEEPDAGPYSGIALYMWSEVVQSTALSPGDVVDIHAEYAEFFGLSQLVVENIGDITVTGTAPLPGPDLVTAAEIARGNAGAEPWEGVRVQIVDAVVVERNDGFGQILVEGDALIGNAFVSPLPKVQLGSRFGSVTGPLHYSFEEFKLLPASATDLADYSGAPTPSEATPIYAIQQDMVREGTVVKLEDVIVSAGFTWSNTTQKSLFVQEPDGGPYSGIQVFVANTTGLDVAPGDVVTVVGAYEEFFDMSQIEVTNASGVRVTGSGPAPSPALIADPAAIATGGAMAESYEGVLVQVSDVTVLDDAPDAPDEFGEFTITGDLRVNDLFFAFADWTKPAIGTGFASITGVLNYDFANFKLEPRDPADLVAN
jgi:hypothetical protein